MKQREKPTPDFTFSIGTTTTTLGSEISSSICPLVLSKEAGESLLGILTSYLGRRRGISTIPLELLTNSSQLITTTTRTF